MGFKAEDDSEPNSTPRLTLSKLPFCKQRDQPPRHMQTPPLLPSVSIPFHWEEAPGKPRASAQGGVPPSAAATPPLCPKSKAARCLELPPRMLHEEAKISIMGSPTSVLEGPYVGRSLSLACTFSFRKGLGPGMKTNLGSGRWGSERKLSRERESFGFPKMQSQSQSLGDIFRSEDNVKMTRVRRRRSFFSLSTVKSKYLWVSFYLIVFFQF